MKAPVTTTTTTTNQAKLQHLNSPNTVLQLRNIHSPESQQPLVFMAFAKKENRNSK
jgi:hypothetical protein